VSYDDAISHVVDVVDVVGAAITSSARWERSPCSHVRSAAAPSAPSRSSEDVGRVILLGLEVLIRCP